MSSKVLTVKQHSPEFPGPLAESEKYVVIQSSSVGELLNLRKNDFQDGDITELLLKIKSGSGKSIYRLGVARSIKGLTKDDINIGYRSRKKLGVKLGDKVTVTKTNWFCYLWHHSESCIKYPFILAVIGGFIAIYEPLVKLFYWIYNIILNIVSGM